MVSLEERISKREEGQTGGEAAVSTRTDNAAPATATSASDSWAEETSAVDSNSKASTVEAKAQKETSDLAKAQMDGGATPASNGSLGLFEPSYEVDVQLSDLQKQSGNPLASIKSFEELGL